MKKETGITLIALIITIIILVILAAVSIRAAYNSGIIDYSINGTKKYQEEAKKEESILSETEGFMASILGRLDELDNGDSGNNDVPDLLRKYVLGADERGKDLYDILDYDWDVDGAFYNDEDSITDAHDTVMFLNVIKEDDSETNGTSYIYIKFDNVGYKIVVDDDYYEETSTTSNVIKVYEPNGDEGEIVEYSVDGTVANVADWLVLYDNGNTVDITPVNIDSSWGYDLGYTDPAAADALPSGSDEERAIWSYNNAIDTLNAYCGTIVTNPTAQAVRSVGTGFGQADTSETYSSTFLTNNPSGQAGDYNGVGKIGDMNAEQDVVRMSFFSPLNVDNPLGYAWSDLLYWYASRRVSSSSDDITFYVRCLTDFWRRWLFYLVCECR